MSSDTATARAEAALALSALPHKRASFDGYTTGGMSISIASRWPRSISTCGMPSSR